MSVVEPLKAGAPAIFVAPDHCPTCDQVIAPDKVGMVNGRLAAREHQLTHDLTERLELEFSRSRDQDRLLAQQALNQARSDAAQALEDERTKAAEREAAAKEAARQEAAATFAQQLAAKQQEFSRNESAFQEQIKTLEENRDSAVRDAARAAHEVAAANHRAAEAETRAREKLTAEFESKTADKVAEAERGHAATLATIQEKHAEDSAAQRAEVSRLQSIVEAEKGAAQIQLDALKQEFAQRETVARAETDELRLQFESSKAEHVAVHEQLRSLRESRDADIATAVLETRDSVEKSKNGEMAALEAKHRDDNQKLKEQLEDTTRRLAQKTAAELGEGAELDLFEELKLRFEGDVIRRVPKGTAGADIIHEIREDGVACGTIVYDSKNRKDWKNEYATKLRADQVAAQAEHAVLSTNKFPAGSRQLIVHEHVIVACPARVVAIAELLREHVVQLHTIRASNEFRDEKIQELYDFMTSTRCARLFETMDSQITNLEEIDEAELAAHKKVWEKRGRVIKSLEKAQGDLRYAVHKIIGSADDDKEDSE